MRACANSSTWRTYLVNDHRHRGYRAGATRCLTCRGASRGKGQSVIDSDRFWSTFINAPTAEAAVAAATSAGLLTECCGLTAQHIAALWESSRPPKKREHRRVKQAWQK